MMRTNVAKVDQKQKLQRCQFELLQMDQIVKSKIAAAEQCHGPISTLNHLCHEVRKRLTEFNEKVVELDELRAFLKLPSERDDAAMLVKRYKLESAQNLHNLRKATVASLRQIDMSERAQLLTGSSDKNDQTPATASSRSAANLANQSSTFSDNLTSLLRTMDAQVKQSEETLKALIGSSQVIGDTETEFRSMGATILSSGKLLSKFGRREFTDRILFVLALLFFFGTVVYIVKKRMF